MLTTRQKQLSDFIKKTITKKGVAPSEREIARHFRISASTTHEHLEMLKEKGYVRKERGRARTLQTTEPKGERLVRIPLLGRIAAGAPIEAIKEGMETIAIPQSRLPFPNSKYYALRVIGNSMVDENINNGDIVVVKKQETAENGQKVVALIDNQETTLKTFYKERGHIRLQPANKDMEPIIVRQGRDFAIQGIVLDVMQTEDASAVPLPIYYPKEEKKELIELPKNQIICGDVVRVMKTFPDKCIDFVVTSPPYDELRNYNGYIFDAEGIAGGLFRVMKHGGVVVWVVGDKIKKGNKSLTSFRQALLFQKAGFNVHDVMIYKKSNTPFMRTNAYTNCFEFMFVFSKGSPKTFIPLKTKTVRQGMEMLTCNKGPDGVNKKILGELKPEKTKINIWEYAVGLHGTTSDKIAFKHPAVFPEKLAEDHILSWTKPGDMVFDPMCGSGTTCKMAKRHDRLYIGCDISPDYVAIARKRLQGLKE